MGVAIVSRGSAAPWYSRVVPPVTRGLVGWFTFDTDIRRLSLNRVPGRGPVQIVGTPAVSGAYARFKGNASYIQTDIPEAAQATIFAVCRTAAPIASASAADSGMYVSTYRGPAVTPGYTGNAFGVSLYQTSTGLAAGGSRDNGSGGITSGGTTLTSGEVATSWGLRVVRVGTQNVARNLTTGQSSTASPATTRVLTGNNFRIGSATDTYAAEVDISSVAIFSEALTDAEIEKLAEVIRSRARRLGIEV